MKKLFIYSALLLLFSQCSKEPTSITSITDYSQYLQDTSPYHKVNKLEEAEFWSKKIEGIPNSYIYYQKLAIVNSELFDKTGKVEYLHTADSLYKSALNMVAGKRKVGTLLSLSSNSIKQHQFKTALNYCLEAYGLTDEKYGPEMMMFDAYMEIGLYDLAESILMRNIRSDDFSYLVRLSKFQDHQGNLDSAIHTMEKAFNLVDNKKSATAQWALSNLADMYGHAGRIEDSYKGYLEVLAINPQYLHALKGIAWVAYSHDKNISAAEDIANYLNKQSATPDMHLLLAEIAKYKGDDTAAKNHIQLFELEASKDKYLDMYNKYLINLYAEQGEYDKALAMATKEIDNRATPLSYDLLAWTYLLKGDNEKALQVTGTHVDGKAFEPEILWHMGRIYAANGQRSKAKNYLDEALNSAYELGPNKEQNIREQLGKI